jgi:hypothetical protein
MRPLRNSTITRPGGPRAESPSPTGKGWGVAARRVWRVRRRAGPRAQRDISSVCSDRRGGRSAPGSPRRRAGRVRRLRSCPPCSSTRAAGTCPPHGPDDGHRTVDVDVVEEVRVGGPESIDSRERGTRWSARRQRRRAIADHRPDRATPLVGAREDVPGPSRLICGRPSRA